MGLDMYVEGWKDGILVESELGYWRKHPDLHGYIVQNLAGGLDECQKIPLSLENLENTLEAVQKDLLPPTSGFFFGKSYSEYKRPTVQMLKKIIKWLKAEDGRSVVYRTSW